MKYYQPKITQADLDAKLAQHEIWWDSCAKKGETLSLPETNLSGLSFRGVQLSGANLTRCNLDRCDFTDAILESINVTESSFYGADLTRANLKRSDFKYIKFDETTLWHDCLYKGMMIDTPTADLLPVEIDKSLLQVIEEYSIRFNFLFN